LGRNEQEIREAGEMKKEKALFLSYKHSFFTGPRGLLPNKKTGTVTFDVGPVVKELKKGKAFFKNDKNGLVHFTFGKVSFDVEKLKENLNAFVKALMAAKPAASKGKFLKSMTISSTMGVGVAINPDEFLRS